MLKVEKGILVAPGATGNQTVSLIDTGFGTVKALLVWGAYQTAEGDTNGDAIFCVGIGTYRSSVAEQHCVSVIAADAVSPTVTASGSRTTSILRGYSGAAAPTVDFDAALVSLGDAQFVINWTDLPATASILFHYLALGGDDITDARVIPLDITTGTGTQNFTVATGFGKPDLMLSLGSNNNTTDGDKTFWNTLFVGAGKSDTEQFVSSIHDGDALATVGLGALQKASFLTYASETTLHVDAPLTARSAWPTDGVQINKVVNTLGAARFGALALRGSFVSVIGAGTAPTAAPTVTQDLPVGSTPRGAVFVHNSLPVISGLETVSADLGTWGIGATDGAREGWAGIGDDDAAAASQTHRHHSGSKAIRMFTPGAAGTLTSEADASFNANNVRLSWPDTDTDAREYRYLLLGDAPTVPTVYVRSDAVHRASRW